MKVLALAAICLLPTIAHSQAEKSGPWEMQNSLTTASLRGIHAVGGGVAWASGTDGTVLRTEDSGYMWQSCAMPPGAEKLDFRGIWAWDANTAIVMSSGPGDQSRLYKTTDGCSHWTLLFTNPDKDGFWDAIAFVSQRRGVILGDPVMDKTANPPANRFALFETFDGERWAASHSDRPKADPQTTAAFAASNSSLVLSQAASGTRRTWIGAGGKGGAAVYIHFLTEPVCTCGMPIPRRNSVPIAGNSSSSGVFSLAFRDDQHGMAVGGDYTKPNESAGTATWTADGGQHWTAAEKPPHGYRSAVAWDADAWIAAGTNGTDISYDDGKTWQPLDNDNWNALSLPWIVGPKGRIAKLGALPARK